MKYLVALLVVVSAGLATLSFYYMQSAEVLKEQLSLSQKRSIVEIETLTKENAAIKKHTENLLSEAKESASKEKLALETKIQELEKKVNLLGFRARPPHGELPVMPMATDATASESTEKKNPMADMMRASAKIMENPRMKDFMRQHMEKQMKSSYAHFITQNNISSEQQQALTDIMLDNQMQMQRIGLEAMKEGSFPTDDAKDTRMLDIAEKMDKAIVDLLGEDLAKTFTRYRAASSELQTINEFTLTVNATETPLTQDQENQLYDMTVNIMNDKTALGDLASDAEKFMDNNGRIDIHKAMNASSDNIIALKEKQNEVIIQQAAGLLSEQQLSLLKHTQKAKLDQLRNGMAIAKAFFKKTDEAQPATDASPTSEAPTTTP